ncbi:ATP-binding protein [Sphingomonas aracearum]|uniref:ATP-binding protein n=2 Tax=Sphingomonas aracearum TaxID=2283317 RepID=A0A369VY93_9SPHN|nr:ATP-binding protein [Sphingomonas aracearum]
MERIARRGPDAIAAELESRGERVCEQMLFHWRLWRRPAQCPPPGDWRVWLVMAGRGFGKTRVGAEWVRAVAENNARARIALVGATQDEVRRVMVEGESGLLAVSHPARRPRWEPSLGRLTWPSGAQAFAFSADRPESLRGPQHSHAWCDEIGKWPKGEEAWDNLMLSLRLGTRPRAVATTTPRPVALIRRLVAEDGVVRTGGRTAANRSALPPAFLKAMTENHGGTRLGRQELDGELIEEVAGALWSRAGLERSRRRDGPAFRRVVVGVDPPASSGGDACGIVAVALGTDGVGYVLEDASVEKATPEAWAAAVAGCAARHGADRVVAEANNGGEMVASVLRAADARLPVRLVHAARGKVARAEPVAMLHAAGRVLLLGVFPALEDELCGLVTGGGYQGPGRSPDRADAMVWALSELMLGGRAEARVRVA